MRSTLLMVSLLALVPGFVIAGIQNVRQFRRTEAETYERARQAVRVAVRYHEEAVRRVATILKAESEELRKRSTAQTCDGLSRAMAAMHLPYVVGDTAGTPRIVCAPSIDGFSPGLSNDDVQVLGRAVAEGKLTQGQHFLASSESESTLGIAFPLPGHESTGFLAVFLPLDWFSALSADLGLPDGSALGIINNRGLVLARHPNPERWVGRVVADAEVYKALAGTVDPGVVDATGIDGVRRIFAFERLGTDRPVSHLVIGISTETLRREARDRVVRVSLGLLIATLGAWLLSGWAAEHLVLRQTRRLIAKAQVLAETDIPPHAEPERGGLRELTELAAAFDSMAARLWAKRQRLDSLSQELLRAQEKERQRIARELHDQMGQSLTALKINLQIEKSTRGDSALTGDNFRIIDGLIAEVRDLALALRPPLLEEQGLQGAVSYLLASEAKRSNLRSAANLQIGDARFAPDLELTVFRVAQESITNAVRYAAATLLEISLTSDGRNLCLTVTDDGTGFDVDAISETGQGFGLLSMRERAALSRGSLAIDSAPGRGTTIRLTVPIDPFLHEPAHA